MNEVYRNGRSDCSLSVVGMSTCLVFGVENHELFWYLSPAQIIASVLGRYHLQSLITCCKGEAWEIWSRVVPSGRPMVDTLGVVPDRASRWPFL